MDENAKFAVGIDVGTENVRAVVASLGREGVSIIGYNEGPNAGMRKGVVANLTGPGESLDRALLEVERMSGYEVNSAYVSINGSHVTSVKAEGMIAVGAEDHEITGEDMARVEEATVVGRVPANRMILDVLPLSYTLDGQSGIKDPLGMTGSRLELKASVISALAPNVLNLKKATEGAKVVAERIVPSVMAAAKAVLTEKQVENGVAVVDLGAATTSVAIYEEGDLQYLGVIPVGANNITNDLAIVLEIDTEIAEDIKKRFVTGLFEESDKDIVIRRGREEVTFMRNDVNRVVKDRLTEIFEEVRKHLKMAKYDRRLPEGIVLVGGGARMREIDVFAKEILEASIKIGAPQGLGGVAEAVQKPEYAAAVGLALMAATEGKNNSVRGPKNKSKKNTGKSLLSFLKKF